MVYKQYKIGSAFIGMKYMPYIVIHIPEVDGTKPKIEALKHHIIERMYKQFKKPKIKSKKK